MSKAKCMAEQEFDRLQDSVAYSPINKLKVGAVQFNNQYGQRYTFEDDSRLYIHYNGSATCELHASSVIRCANNWHTLNTKTKE